LYKDTSKPIFTIKKYGMRQGTLIKYSGDVIELNIPDAPSEITLRAKLDFDEAEKVLLTYLTETPDINSGYYLYLMCKGLTDFFLSNNGDPELDLNEFIEVEVSDLIDESGNIKESVLEAHLAIYKETTIKPPVDSTLTTLTAIWDHIKSVIASYKYVEQHSEDYSFHYKGEDFKVFKKYKDALYNESKFEKVSVGELTEAFDVTRLIEKRFKDKNSSTLLTEMLSIIAILARKDGERFPIDHKDAFIASRASHFIDIPFDIASNVFFYLIPSLDTYLKEMISAFFSHHQKELGKVK
jgi:hypothetical protein